MIINCYLKTTRSSDQVNTCGDEISAELLLYYFMRKTILVFLLLIPSFYVFGQSCTLAVSLSASSSNLCIGSTVVLTATASAGTGPYTYIWSTGETTSTISVNKAGTYNVSVSDQTPGCEPVKQSITITAVSVPPPTAQGVIICQSGPATLSATSPGGQYQWYDSGGNFLANGATYVTPTISATTTFYVQTTLSGCTSARKAVTVTLADKPTVTYDAVCAGNTATLTAAGADSYVWYDSASGGNILSSTPTLTTAPLTQNTTFYLVATTGSCTSARIPEVVQISAPPQPPTAADVSTCMGTTANLHASAPTGVLEWFAGPNGGTPLISNADFTTPPLTSTTTYYVENLVNNCESARVPVTVTIIANPQMPPPQTTTVCYNSSAVLTASLSPVGTYQWYDAATGGNLLANGNTFTTPALKSVTTYYVQNTNAASCSSERAAITVTVKIPTQAPSVSQPLICPGTSAVLTATSPGGTYQWFDAASGGNLLATGASFTTPQLSSSKTYYVQTTILGCISPRTAVTVSVVTPSAGPVVKSVAICSGSSATLITSGPNGDYAWYDSAIGGNYLSSGQVFITPVLTNTTTYYAEVATTNRCSSARTPVTVTVNAIPLAPVVNAGPAVCPGSSATLQVTSAGGTNQWYDAASGGNLVATSNTFTTPPIFSNTTYYVQNVSNTCTSTRTAVTATVISVASPAFQYPSGTVCSSQATFKPVINNPSGGTFSASPAGLIFVSNKTGEINVALSKPGDYTVSFAGNGVCPATSSAGVAIVSATDAKFSYNGPFCVTNPLPAFAAGASAGNFSASPSGVVFTNTTTGEINLAKSKPGTYKITNTIAANGPCQASTATATIVIDPAVIISAGPDQTVAAGKAVQLKGSVSGANGKWTGGKGTFSNINIPNPIYTPAPSEKSVTLTYTSTNPPIPCGIKTSKMTIIISAGPPAPTALSQAVCAGTVTTLSATAPGGNYQWYDALTGGNLLASGPNFTTPPITAGKTYYVSTTIGGISSARTAVAITVNPSPVTPVAGAVSPICQGTSAKLTASGSTGSYEWYDDAAGGNLVGTGSTFITPNLMVNTTYYLLSRTNGCTSPTVPVIVKVIPAPVITSPANGTVCSGVAQNYSITTDLPATGFIWSRAQVAGISNPAVNGQTSATINETLINTGTTTITVTYKITALNGNCSSAETDYIVNVYPAPVAKSAATATFCSGQPGNYTFALNDPSATFTWSRAAVPGISNTAVSGQSSADIHEVLFNTTNAPVNVIYTFNPKGKICDGQPFNVVVKVNPEVTVTSLASGFACSGIPQDYAIKTNLPSATFSWSRAKVAGISNAAVANQTSPVITESLVNTRTVAVRVVYTIIPSANGCTSNPFIYTVIVNPATAQPVVSSNTPVCTGSTIQLSAVPVDKSTYSWTGPNGFKSALQSPSIPNATSVNAGTYSLIIITNGCPGQAASTNVNIDELPVADAGNNITVCAGTTSVPLNGKVSGGTTTGLWSTSGTGKFSPQANQLNGAYIPSAQDRTAGSVTLTLSSTSKDDCALSTSSMKITFGKVPASNAGPDLEVCSQDLNIKMAGKLLISGTGTWSTLGTGSFGSSENSLDATYTPSNADIAAGSVKLVLLANAADACYFPTDTMIVKFIPPPTLNAGGTRYVLAGHTITLTPTVSDNNVTYKWSPAVDINDVTLKNPTITGNVDRTYTLTVTDSRGCTSTDQTLIKVSPKLNIPNVFTPNGDGINDKWNIDGLVAFESAAVDIFDRYGQKVFHETGYAQAWDGTLNGKMLPTGTYYYVINTNMNNLILSGPVTIIR